ncbi:glycogen debranching protein GlgX [Tabrizicola oligotrophica]|uniref:Glycogen debranching protein GlgX n=1 Tax=Tabrizicola oligotrophica TaxID=2710650 RepID=A0A6M0QRU8_9RHOB|nr:glycogen debranching protein GlgX [Tabrizicola oligotrophica]NEY89162.1 glycogen debranching protein GlgX [Tabrizicola oligotrophica]
MDRVTAGRPYPMGATIDGAGVNFAVFSAHATALELCLDGQAPLPITARSGDIWHVHVAGLGAGARYGFRAHGPWEPARGHRFNPAKLLIDPYAREITGRMRWHPDLAGPADSAGLGHWSVVTDGAFDWGADRARCVPLAETVIYEAHVKALTRLHPAIPEADRGSYRALGHPAIIQHLQDLGVTTLELLPVHAYIDDRFVTERGLVNHWGYNSIGFFAAESRHGSLTDLKSAVKALHAGGIEVVLDVVYNHTGEGDAFGPTLSLRGLDNASYYRLAGGHDLNDAGTGNTLNLSHPAVLRLVMDSLRYWVEEVHVDGFRFDLAPVLGRAGHGFDPNAPFFAALMQDPVLARVKLIAEPWDLGPGGYRLGQFPGRFVEWNDRFRDGVRKFWRGDAGMAADLAERLLGSAGQFDHSRRAPQASVNYLTAHDGFTLEDVVSYRQKRNMSNGEMNRDGHHENQSDNLGVEGPSAEPGVLDARARRKRAMLATLMLAQGTPLLLAGDELGHSQRGNNNAYAQDNETTWVNWAGERGLARFIARLTALRAAHPVLRQTRFLHGEVRPDGLANVIWRRADGAVPGPEDWRGDLACLGLELRAGDGGAGALYCVFNAGGPCRLTLPDTAPGWTLILSSADPDLAPALHHGALDLPGQSVFVLEPQP